MANDGQKKSMVLKALDTVERVGNRLPDPAVIFLILTGIVILVSALCGFLGLSVTYDFLDRTSGEITKKTVEAVSFWRRTASGIWSPRWCLISRDFLRWELFLLS